MSYQCDNLSNRPELDDTDLSNGDLDIKMTLTECPLCTSPMTLVRMTFQYAAT